MDTKDIYKITNLLNKKSYIGQSKNVLRRMQEHKSNSNSAIGLAIKKYGENNFSLEILEVSIENYSEREKYWIAFYNTNDRSFGYNLTEGGENPPITKGENSILSKYGDEMINNAQLELISNEKTFQEISDKFEISVEYLSTINRGMVRVNNVFSYPLRVNGNETVSKERVSTIIIDLLYSSKTKTQIAQQGNLSRKTIDKINKGEHLHSNKSIDYPIRKNKSRYSTLLLNNIVKDVTGSAHTFKQIESFYNISKSSLSRINNGSRYRVETLNYPLRSSHGRVCNL